MRRLRFACLAAFALAAASAVAQPAQSDPAPIVVEGEAARVEIERILNADNVDTGSLGTSEVVATISRIPRGRAPDDFWTAYQAHVRAWERFAAAETQLLAFQSGKREGLDQAMADYEAATREIERSFGEVERIAQRYGVQMPTPATAEDPDDMV